MKTQKRDTQSKFEPSQRGPRGSPTEEKSMDAQLVDCVQTYLSDIKEIRDHPELEVRIGGYPFITKMNFDNVVKKLLSLGFKTTNIKGVDLLRINVTDQFDSYYRAEINDFKAIQDYCIHESIQRITTEYNGVVRFEQKRQKAMVMNYDYNLKYAYSVEKVFSPTSTVGIIENWNKSGKMFRYMNRVTFKHADLPIIVDMSIVKQSGGGNGPKGKQFYSLKTADLFNQRERYEIELEVDNDLAKDNTAKSLIDNIKKVVKYVLMGLQETSYPISYTEQKMVLNEYMKLTRQPTDYKRRINSRNFIGPSSNTLQMINIMVSSNRNIPNIRYDYVATEKADGDRALLFIMGNKDENDERQDKEEGIDSGEGRRKPKRPTSNIHNGKVYLINSNMNIIFTGVYVEDATVHLSLLDGENILKDKSNQSIHLYTPFDIYFYKGKDTREMPLFEKDPQKYSRDDLLTECVNLMNEQLKSVIRTKMSLPITIKRKQFYDVNPTIDPETVPNNMKIFTACYHILNEIGDSFVYNTDGIIFTPKYLGVGFSPTDKSKKKTWDYSFKWKPPKYNTIDFLVRTIKNAQNTEDAIQNYLGDGLNTTSMTQIKEYKTLRLCVGYDPFNHLHGYIDPCNMVYSGEFKDMKLINPQQSGNRSNYKPVQFQPTDPPDFNAGICNIELNAAGLMMTEEGDSFQDDMIVEFAYVTNNEPKWKWVPLRVRYDKTARHNQGENEFGNAFHVANNNWKSIHNPITDYMITTGYSIPTSSLEDQDKYYNRETTATSTAYLRDFHNKYVKKLLIESVSKRDDTLIDYACGKAGDLSKWIDANLSFVFGIDKSNDNIVNRLDGACARYLNNQFSNNTNRRIPDALFIQGDSTKNIRDGQALSTETGKIIMQTVFGECSREESETVGQYVVEQYDKGKDGFNVSSCQFAIHYFFENITTLTNFLINVAQCTKKGGYFIGTCYDGKSIFNMLRNVQNGSFVKETIRGKKIWEIMKKYKEAEFRNDSSSLGYEISVFQESIGNYFSEYLVNFDYLNKLMELYGFKLITGQEANKLGLPEGSGLFEILYRQMEMKLRKDPNLMVGDALYMTPEEKKVSFLNRYFVFQKIRDVDLKQVVIEDNGGLIKKSMKVKTAVKTAKEFLSKATGQEFNIESESGIKTQLQGQLTLKDYEEGEVVVPKKSKARIQDSDEEEGEIEESEESYPAEKYKSRTPSPLPLPLPLRKNEVATMKPASSVARFVDSDEEEEEEEQAPRLPSPRLPSPRLPSPKPPSLKKVSEKEEEEEEELIAPPKKKRAKTIKLGENGSPKKPKNKTIKAPKEPNLAKEAKDAEKLAAKEAKDAEKLAVKAAKDARDAEKLAIKQAKEVRDAEKLAAKAAKEVRDAEKLAAKAAKEAKPKKIKEKPQLIED